MITNILVLTFLFLTSSFLINYIKKLKTGDERENDNNFWMFTYDFRSKKKLEFNPEEKNILIKKRFKNKMIFLLYINILFIFLFLNSFVSQILIIIAN
tara:strand:- start:77 stop:370 length:294 start_codon:yes stop_codon:yes gene_type:complete